MVKEVICSLNDVTKARYYIGQQAGIYIVPLAHTASHVQMFKQNSSTKLLNHKSKRRYIYITGGRTGQHRYPIKYKIYHTRIIIR
jgi:hypothetical protein